MSEQKQNETEPVYPIPLETSFFNERGTLTISAYQQMLSYVAERALEDTNINVPSLIARYGAAWVLLSISLAIRRPVRRDDGQLYARTWNTWKAGFIYRRDVGLYDAESNRIVSAAMFFSVLDIKTRKLAMDPALHAELTLPGGEELIEASSRVSTKGLAFETVEKRSVRPSWIDYLGHVNNARYGELAYDALTDAERRDFVCLSRLDLSFMHELLPGSEVAMERAEDGGALYMRASLLPENTPSFVVRMEFGNR